MTKTAEDGEQGLSEREAVKRIAAELGVSAVTVSVNLPYQSVVYKLEKRSKNAVKCERWRKNGKGGVLTWAMRASQIKMNSMRMI